MGYTGIAAKSEEIKRAIDDGADDIDAVINIAALKSDNWNHVNHDIDSVARATHLRGKTLKLILECALLTDEQIASLPFDLYRQGFEYYWKTHAHPNSTFRCTMSSLLDLMSFDAATNMDLINQPLLMMAGSNADSLYMTQSAFKDAVNAKDKEFFKIEGATHIETYWKPQYVNQAMEKLTRFYGKSL